MIGWIVYFILNILLFAYIADPRLSSLLWVLISLACCIIWIYEYKKETTVNISKEEIKEIIKVIMEDLYKDRYIIIGIIVVGILSKTSLLYNQKEKIEPPPKEIQEPVNTPATIIIPEAKIIPIKTTIADLVMKDVGEWDGKEVDFRGRYDYINLKDRLLTLQGVNNSEIKVYFGNTDKEKYFSKVEVGYDDCFHVIGTVETIPYLFSERPQVNAKSIKIYKCEFY